MVRMQCVYVYTCMCMHFIYCVCVFVLSPADVVLKSGTLDRRTYKGKAQLCEFMCQWWLCVFVSWCILQNTSYVATLYVRRLWYTVWTDLCLVTILHAHVCLLFTHTYTYMIMCKQPLAHGTVACSLSPWRHLLLRNQSREQKLMIESILIIGLWQYIYGNIIAYKLYSASQSKTDWPYGSIESMYVCVCARVLWGGGGVVENVLQDSVLSTYACIFCTFHILICYTFLERHIAGAQSSMSKLRFSHQVYATIIVPHLTP